LGMELKGWSSLRVTPASVATSGGGTKSRGTSGDSVSVSKRMAVSVGTGTRWSFAPLNLLAGFWRLDFTRGGLPSGLTSGPKKQKKIWRVTQGTESQKFILR
jgi:hypothetical protein